jgi:hypothetical protein
MTPTRHLALAGRPQVGHNLMNGAPTAMSHPTRSGDAKMDDFALPVTRYALSGDVSIAYQVMGDGPVDLVMGTGRGFAR